MREDRPGIRSIRIVKGDRVFHVHGEQAGTEGAWLAKGQVDKLYDAPIKTTYKSGAFQQGSRFRYARRLHRDMKLGFHLKETSASYEFNDSLFRQMFEYEPDKWDPDPDPTTIIVETDMSGTRRIDVLMYEEPEFAPELDPLEQEYGNVILKLRAPDPMWYEDMTEENGSVSIFEAPTTDAQGLITIQNPTDNVMYQKWVVTQAVWDLPDPQWVGKRGIRAPGGANAARIIGGINVAGVNGGATVDLDRMALMYRDKNNTNLLAQVGNSRIFVYPVPPYTPPTDLPVAYSGAIAGGARAELRMPRRWSRPWGMELPGTGPTLVHQPKTIYFGRPGISFSYQIPVWADAVDVVAVGGGAGGNGAGLFNWGGGGGDWGFVTLVRGDNLPRETKTITGMVGWGGGGGGWVALGWAVPPGDGGPTIITAEGMDDGLWGDTMAVAGGHGGASPNSMSGLGPAPQYREWNGRLYAAGGACPAGSGGYAPGGGGSGGWPLQNGYTGAPGGVWLRAYQLEVAS